MEKSYRPPVPVYNDNAEIKYHLHRPTAKRLCVQRNVCVGQFSMQTHKFYGWEDTTYRALRKHLNIHSFYSGHELLMLKMTHNLITCCRWWIWFNLLKPAGHVMHQQFNIQQLYVLPTHTHCICVLYLSENKQRLVPLTA